MSVADVAASYPREITLASDKAVEIRLMVPEDRDAVLAFARKLPEEDLLFLRVDITQAAVVDDWVERIRGGSSTSLVAYAEDELIGYATVHRNDAPWTRGLGELRVNVSPAYRGKGLGRVLTAQIFDLSQALGLRKLTAQMTADQRGAQAAFRRLGFVQEALLADYVEDRNGTPRDLVIMSHDVDGHSEVMVSPLRNR
jgi:RimJ/RimL family protein N-acetyltransferase